MNANSELRSPPGMLDGYRRRLLDLLAGTAHEPPGIMPRSQRQSALPLSFAQERLWFMEQLQVTGAAYNIASAKETILDVVGRTLDDALRLETINAYSSLGDFTEARGCLAQFYSKGKGNETKKT